MLSPFPPNTPYPILLPPAHQTTHSRFPVLAFPYTGISILHRTKGLFSHLCLTRPSSATYVWLVVYSLGALGVLVGSYCCSSYGAASSFSSFGPFCSSSIRPCAQFSPWLRASTSVFVRHWQRLSGDSYISGLRNGSADIVCVKT